MVCDRVAILVEGLVARQGTLSELTEETVEYRITISDEAPAMQDKIQALGGSLDGTVVTLSEHDVDKVNAVIDLLRGAGLLIESVQPHRFSLEEILVQVLADQSAAPSVIPMALPPSGSVSSPELRVVPSSDRPNIILRSGCRRC